MRICLRYASSRDDAADILNKAFFNIFTHLDQFRAEGDLFAWMKRIVINAAIDFVRSRRRLGFHDPVEAAAELPGASGPDLHIHYDDLLRYLHSLPETSGAVFNLFVIEGFSHREIGAMLGISEGNSKWHLHQARQILQQKLQTREQL